VLSRKAASVVRANPPSSGGEAGDILGNGAGAARNVQLPDDHIQFSAAAHFCSLLMGTVSFCSASAHEWEHHSQVCAFIE
jgi:hypothetical protein